MKNTREHTANYGVNEFLNLIGDKAEKDLCKSAIKDYALNNGKLYLPKPVKQKTIDDITVNQIIELSCINSEIDQGLLCEKVLYCLENKDSKIDLKYKKNSKLSNNKFANRKAIIDCDPKSKKVFLMNYLQN